MYRSCSWISLIVALLGLGFSSQVLLAVDGASPDVASVGNETAVEKLIEIGEEDNRVMDVLHHVVNVIGPRLSGSHNDHVACEWAKEQFESFGLKNVVMEEAGEFPVGFNRGPWSGKMTSPEELVLEFGTPAWSAGTRGTVRGPAMLPPTELEGADSAAYAGAWMVMPGQGRRRMPREQRQQQAEIRRFLEEAGVAGFITSTRNDYIQTLGSVRGLDWENLPTIPRIYLLKSHYESIVEKLNADEAVELQFDIRNYFERGPAKFYNVYADLVGTEFPDEYVVVGGHIDSWDGATGTTDNGMGTATTVEAARMLVAAGAKPRRTIRFMLWSGEEQGLLGSRAYVEKYPELMESISAVLVYDGGPNAVASLPTTEAMHPQMEKAFSRVFGLHPELPFELKMSNNGLPRGAGSDHLSFIREGVPGFFWDQQGKANTWHGIHTQFDTYDLAIPEYLEHSTLVIALAALGVADLDNLLDRTGMEASGGRSAGGRRMGVYLSGLEVDGVVPDSPAEKGGIQAGDVFVKVSGTVVDDRRSLVRAIQGGEPSKKVVMKRGDKEVEVELVWPEEIKAKEEEKKKAEKKKVIL